MFKPLMGIDVNVRNTEKSEIRILVYIRTYTHIHTHTYIDRPQGHNDICVYTVDTKTLTIECNIITLFKVVSTLSLLGYFTG